MNRGTHACIAMTLVIHGWWIVHWSIWSSTWLLPIFSRVVNWIHQQENGRVKAWKWEVVVRERDEKELREMKKKWEPYSHTAIGTQSWGNFTSVDWYQPILPFYTTKYTCSCYHRHLFWWPWYTKSLVCLLHAIMDKILFSSMLAMKHTGHMYIVPAPSNLSHFQKLSVRIEWKVCNASARSM